MKIDPKLVEQWFMEAAQTRITFLEHGEYIAQRAADHALEEAAKHLDVQNTAITDLLASEIRAMKGTK